MRVARSVGRACPRVHRERSLTRRVLQGLGRVIAGEQARGEEVGGEVKGKVEREKETCDLPLTVTLSKGLHKKRCLTSS